MIVTGLQPTGSIHLGNYLGAIQPLTKMMRGSRETLVFIADYHAITMGHDPKALRESGTKLAATLIACGVDDALIFRQSDVPAHVELGWILQCTARTGWLNRMTQFREKSGLMDRRDLLATLEEIADASWPSVNGDDPVARIKAFARGVLDEALVGENAEGPSVGLYTYPVLQAADVLLYGATEVPVGDDQSQHLNLVADIARKFNHDFGDTFVIPKAVIPESGKRVMSLQDGTKKMSKSDANPDSRIHLDDYADDIQRKVKRAKSDTALIPGSVEELMGRPELTNLLSIYGAFAEKSLSEAVAEFEGKGYGALKPALAEVLVEGLRPIQEGLAHLKRYEVEEVLETEGGVARDLAAPRLEAARKAIGVA